MLFSLYICLPYCLPSLCIYHFVNIFYLLTIVLTLCLFTILFSLPICLPYCLPSLIVYHTLFTILFTLSICLLIVYRFTNARLLHNRLDEKIEWKHGCTYVPKGNKKLLCLIDDLNLAQVRQNIKTLQPFRYVCTGSAIQQT